MFRIVVMKTVTLNTQAVFRTSFNEAKDMT